MILGKWCLLPFIFILLIFSTINCNAANTSYKLSSIKDGSTIDINDNVLTFYHFDEGTNYVSKTSAVIKENNLVFLIIDNDSNKNVDKHNILIHVYLPDANNYEVNTSGTKYKGEFYLIKLDSTKYISYKTSTNIINDIIDNTFLK